jgi:hypothetical protein
MVQGGGEWQQCVVFQEDEMGRGTAMSQDNARGGGNGDNMSHSETVLGGGEW